MVKNNKKEIRLFGFLTFILTIFCFIGGVTPMNKVCTSAEEKPIYKLYSGKVGDVTMSIPTSFADPSARTPSQLLSSAFLGEVRNEGSMELRAYTGYNYGAANFTFANPVKNASNVKRMWIEMTIHPDTGSDRVTYINGSALPYFRLYPVDSNGVPIATRYFEFTDKNSKVNQAFTMELTGKDIQLLIDNKDEIETLQWSFYHNQTASGNGLAIFSIRDISYEYYDLSDSRTVTYFVNETPIYSESTYYYATPPTLNKAGYTAEWLTEDGEVYDFSEPITKDTKLKLSWKGNAYTIKFQTNGGSLVKSIIAVTDEPITLPEAPTKTGYEFVGWYIDSTLATPFDESMQVTENMSLYAKWRAVASDVQYTSASCGASIGVTSIGTTLTCVLFILFRKKGGFEF